MSNGIQRLLVEQNFSNLCIRFGTWRVLHLKWSRSTGKTPMWATQTFKFMGRLKIRDVWLTGSNMYLFMYLIARIRSGKWKVWCLNWALLTTFSPHCYLPFNCSVSCDTLSASLKRIVRSSVFLSLAFAS